jgi:hypothetical protein
MLTVEVHEHRMIEALIGAERLGEVDAGDRARLGQAISALLDDFAEEWSHKGGRR